MTTQNRPNPPLNFPSISPATPTNTQACAACKYQRRRCPPHCPLAPFFPPTLPKYFNNARRLFGVKNLIKVATSMTPSDRENAVKSMIYEANVRDVDPVGGCCRIVMDLKNRIAQCESELNYCKGMIEYFSNLNLGNGVYRNPNFDGEGFGGKNVVVFNGGSSSGSGGRVYQNPNFDGEGLGGKNVMLNGGSSSGSGLPFGGVNVKPLVKELESSGTKQLWESVAPKKDDVEAIQPPKQAQRQRENYS